MKMQTVGSRPPSRRPIYQGVGGMLARAVDATVGAVLPGVAHRMRLARVKSHALLSSYAAADDSRLNPIRRTRSADAEILTDLDTLRSASRAAVRDDPHSMAMVLTAEDNIVGTGIRPQGAVRAEDVGVEASVAADWNRACEAEFERWSDDSADATRQGTFYDLQRLMVRTRKVDGEALAHAIVGGDFMIACEIIDVDRLGSAFQMASPTMRGGVEIGPHGAPIRYHILESHPDDAGSMGGGKTRPIPAFENGLSIIQHVFRRIRPGQTRGVPDFACSLTFGKHLGGYLNSEVIAARAASNYAMFIKRQVDPTDPDIMPVQSDDVGQTQEYHETLEAGTIQYLNEGEEPVPFSPNRPGAQFDAFVKRILRAMTASQGMAYELVVKDFAGLNYSNARAMLLEVRRTFDSERQMLIHQFCVPWWRNVIRLAVESGRLPKPPRWAELSELWLRARWVAPSYGWVDPVKEIQSSVAAVSANLSTPYDEAARGGAQAEAILESRARFLARAAALEEEHGLQPGSLSGLVPPQQLQQQPQQQQPAAQVPDDEDDDEAEQPDEPDEGDGSGSSGEAGVGEDRGAE